MDKRTITSNTLKMQNEGMLTNESKEETTNLGLPSLTTVANSNMLHHPRTQFDLPMLNSSPYEIHNRLLTFIDKLPLTNEKDDRNSQSLASTNPERSMFQQSPSSQTHGVSIFVDADLFEKVSSGARITKDIIVWFYWEKAFQKANDFEACDVYIDNSIYYSGNSKKKRKPKEENSLVLNAIVTDNNQVEMKVCSTCNNPNNKAKGMMILVRNVTRIGTDLKVMASLTCSGNPSSATRLLQVRFSLTQGNTQISLGESIYFCVYHHRRKLKRKNVEDVVENQSVVKHYKLLKPDITCDLEDIESPQVKELTAHLVEVILADTNGKFFSESLLHLTLRDLDIFIQNYQVYDTSCLITLAEFFINANGIGHKAYDPFTQFDGDTGKQMKSLQSYLRNMANISRLFSQKANERDMISWQRIQKSFWEFVYEPQNGRKFCACQHCVSTHLNFVLKYLRNQGSFSPELLLENLNELNISPKSGKNWQSIIFGKIDDELNFNWTLYLQSSPLGKFSRKWYPAPHMKSSGMNALITTTTPFYAARHWEDAKIVFAVRSLDVEQQMLQKNLSFFDQILGYLKMLGDEREVSTQLPPLDDNSVILPPHIPQVSVPIQLPVPVQSSIRLPVPLIHDYIMYPQNFPSIFPVPSNFPDATLTQIFQQVGMLSPADLEQLFSNPAWQNAVSNTLRSFKPNLN